MTVKYKQGMVHIFILKIQILNKTATGSTDREVTFFYTGNESSALYHRDNYLFIK